MKFLSRFGFLILSAILVVRAIFDYIDYRHLLLEMEQENPLIDIYFGDGYIALSFLIISFYELIIKYRWFKLLVRVFLVLLFIGIILKNVIPIEDFDAGVENTAMFSGTITLLLLFVHSLKLLYYRMK